MDLNHSCSVTLNDGHFITLHEFGTFASDELSGARRPGEWNTNSLEGWSEDPLPMPSTLWVVSCRILKVSNSGLHEVEEALELGGRVSLRND
ncbi:hypothetical protein HPG69_014145 [Diceros bicornis minor]|uniref:Uncharacterized protein n=1 Tax=Diceros bicornis minor TaxID=77932 RepID=A0A7J7FJ33_DICBM|nr:hypothetical protein HPG69_014145 [Diceros bicornis minor]